MGSMKAQITMTMTSLLRTERYEMKGIGCGFEIMYAFLWIYCNFSFTAKLYFSGGKIWVKYVVFWWISYLTSFPLTKSIHVWQLSLNNSLQNQELLKIFGSLVKHKFWKKMTNSENQNSSTFPLDKVDTHKFPKIILKFRNYQTYQFEIFNFLNFWIDWLIW